MREWVSRTGRLYVSGETGAHAHARWERERERRVRWKENGGKLWTGNLPDAGFHPNGRTLAHAPSYWAVGVSSGPNLVAP
jgi:hypothetical protein